MWHTIAKTADLPLGASLECVFEDKIIAIFNVDGKVHALDGVCPHQGGPLGKGRLNGCVVTCPWHGWQFDVTTGQHRLNPKYSHPRYDARIVGDEIQIEIKATS